jgi:hypothetical protein
MLPKGDPPGDLNAAVAQIVNYQLSSKRLGREPPVVVEADDSVIRVLVLAGANPIPMLLLPPGSQGLPDIFEVFPELPSITCTYATFKCVLAAFANYMTVIAIEQRARFVEALYGFLATALSENPRMH